MSLARFNIEPNYIPDAAFVAITGLAVYLASGKRKLRKRLAITEKGKQEAEEKASKMEKLAMRDSLTGLYTRRGLEKTYAGLQTAGYHRPERKGDPEAYDKTNTHSLLILDIDHFKQVNDSLGHDKGDLVLRSVANVLTARSRERDVPSVLADEGSEYASRWGGEEMALLLPRATETDAVGVAEEIRQLVEQEGQVTVSIGVVGLDLDYSLGKNVKFADQALYAAKNGGRNRVVAFSSLSAQNVTV